MGAHRLREDVFLSRASAFRTFMSSFEHSKASAEQKHIVMSIIRTSSELGSKNKVLYSRVLRSRICNSVTRAQNEKKFA